MHKSLLEKSNIEIAADEPRLVNMTVPHKLDSIQSFRDTETWLTILEQTLACNFSNYDIKIDQDNYHQITNVSIMFNSVEDAVLFRMQRS